MMQVRFDLKASSVFTRFLDGSQFSDNLRVQYHEHPSKIPDRIETLEKLASEKNVVHIGFCDHIPIVAAKLVQNTWLHSRLRAVARRCVGVDIDERAVEHIATAYGVDDVFAGDITSSEPLPPIISEHWNIMIIGEVLEHIGNPVQFLTRIRQVYSSNIDRVVITVPNAFRG